MFAFAWLIWGVIFWWIAKTLAQTHGATWKQSMSVACKKKPREALENMGHRTNINYSECPTPTHLDK